MTLQRQAGFAAVEYTVVCAALALALFVPIQDDPASPDKGRSTIEILSAGLQKAYKNFSHATSLPL